MAKIIITKRPFSKMDVEQINLVSFMGWERLINLIAESEEIPGETLAGFEINEDGITLKFSRTPF